MPGTLNIHVIGARDLPIMDQRSRLADAYVVVRFATFKEEMITAVCKKTLDPVWNERFSLAVHDDVLLQDSQVEFAVMDKDMYTADEVIGVVMLDVEPLLSRAMRDESPSMIGWFPICDTLVGFRGELHVEISLDQYIKDVNPTKDASGGVRFFGISHLSHTLFPGQFIIDFVEELIVEGDPEYAFSDNFRTARKSNQARLLLLNDLSCKLRRVIGQKVLAAGGNAILGFREQFDLEGDSGIVARAYGTIVRLVGTTAASPTGPAVTSGQLQADLPVPAPVSPIALPSAVDGGHHSGVLETKDGASEFEDFMLDSRRKHRSARRRSRDMLTAGNAGHHFTNSSHTVQLITMTQLPHDVKVKLGGMVAARSVKFLGGLNTKVADQNKRDKWWLELREEIRSHARILNCNQVIGYEEHVDINNDVCILSATGTAAVLRPIRVRPGLVPPPSAIGRYPSAPAPDSTVPTISQPVRAATADAVVVGAGAGAGASASASASANDESLSAAAPSLLAQSSATFTEASRATSDLTGADESASRPTYNRHRLRSTESFGSHSSADTKRKSVTTPVIAPTRLGLPSTGSCALVHVPYRYKRAPFSNMKLVQCAICKTKWVPEVLFCTVEPPPGLPVSEPGLLVEARVCTTRDKLSGESGCVDVSKLLIFMEVELHRQLLLKLRLMGRNAVFALQSNVHLGDTMIVGHMSGTAVFVEALPPAPPVLISRGRTKRSDGILMAVSAAGVAYEHPELQSRVTAISEAFQAGLSGYRRLWKHRATRQLRDREGRGSDVDSIAEGPATGAATATATGTAATTTTGAVASTPVAAKPPTPVSAGPVAPEPMQPLPAILAVGGAVAEADSPTEGTRFDIPRGTSAHSASHVPPPRSATRQSTIGPENTFASVRTKLSYDSDLSSDSTSSESSDEAFDDDDALQHFVVEMGQNVEDILAAVFERHPPPGLIFLTSEAPVDGMPLSNIQHISCVRRASIGVADMARRNWNEWMAQLFHSIHASLVFKLRKLVPCTVCGLRTQIRCPDDNTLEVLLTGMVVLPHIRKSAASMVLREGRPLNAGSSMPWLLPAAAHSLFGPQFAYGQEGVEVEGRQGSTFSMLSAPITSGSFFSASSLPRGSLTNTLTNTEVSDDEGEPGTMLAAGQTTLRELSMRSSLSDDSASQYGGEDTDTSSSSSVDGDAGRPGVHAGQLEAPRVPFAPSVELSTLSYIPGTKIRSYLGRVQFHLIRESVDVKAAGGLGTFYFAVLHEAGAMIKRLTLAMGGDAVLGYQIVSHESTVQVARNQAYVMITAFGDAVLTARSNPSVLSPVNGTADPTANV